ncbi:hypothetical protein VN12_08405 [Pirellula sp. SH-Sr6A]|uniref:hypothetical protein n=1 Tax=Pirellula sp. SH-Sr6A TaxID=1632865 RepID=UPI00078EB49E|nr:hypothetical protein [Pirellula sp. SH-Sr6A]AMV32130.1 hypothetical protein VN12_08405 [Pirellula sp. SH-Sr6A]
MTNHDNTTMEAIYEYAKLLRDRGWRTTYAAVGAWLKHSGFKRASGKDFSGAPRGAAKVITDTFDYVLAKYGPDQAQIIFYAFCSEDGLHRSRGEVKRFKPTGEEA